MKAKFKITNPDIAECTLAITMPLSAWKRLKEQLKRYSYPSFKLARAINELIHKAEQEFESVKEAGD